MSKGNLLRILRIVVTILLLGFVVWKTGLFTPEGRSEFLAVVVHADVFLLVLSFFIPTLQDFICAFKWYFLCRAIQLEGRVWQLFVFYVMGRFFNLVLPSNIGGDLIRIHLHGKATGNPAHAAAAVFMERLTGMIMLLLIAMLAAYLQSSLLDIQFIELAMLLTIIGTLAVTWLLFDDRLFGFFERQVLRWVPATRKIFVKVNKMRSGLRLYRDRPSTILIALFNSFLFYVSAILKVWVLVLTFEADISLFAMCVAVPLIMVLMNLPISVGGIGLMEFAFTLVLGAVGVSPEAALAAALLMRVQTLVSASMGGIFYGLHHDKSAEDLLQSKGHAADATREVAAEIQKADDRPGQPG